MANKFLGLVFASLLAAPVLADEIALNPNHPDSYVVVKGDTLWDISGRFLRDPWLWPEVWHVNPQIANPHLIYPGDVITLVYIDGKPQLRIDRGHPNVKLSPTAREERLDRAIPTIPIDAIKQFLTQPLVVGEGELEAAPYVVESADEHIVTGAGDRVYVRGLTDTTAGRYNLYKPGAKLIDPDTNEMLGIQAIYLGDATVQKFGEPATLALENTTREVGIGDRLKSISADEIHASFLPHPPTADVKGRILAVLDGVSQIGRYQIVAVSRGTREGMEVGHVLRVQQAGQEVKDKVTPAPNDMITLPDEDAGLVMLFRTFEKVSYGLVMEATRPIHVNDYITTP
ncbi:MAG: LysM peptidoglycan-binding domain-containing protein [Gammaproteobacteria bacterium]|nr:LysM peptidoglycan-binding domain-containing protein [Gammaproteobacteria bacterium]